MPLPFAGRQGRQGAGANEGCPDQFEGLAPAAADLANIGGLRIVLASGEKPTLGETMRKSVLLAMLLAAAAAQPGLAADKAKSSCPPASAREAEVAIRFVTDLMVVSSVCQDTVYAEFRLRNRDAIVGYQNAMISSMHGNAAFDRWNTSLANQAASKQAGNQQICIQSAALLQQAKAMDVKGFRAYAAAQAASGGTSCGK
jgi:hypothetical protein